MREKPENFAVIFSGNHVYELYFCKRLRDCLVTFRNKKQTVGEHSRTINRDSGIDSTYELHIDDMLL